MEGVCLNGSINIDANSDMRRSATLKFVILDSSFEVSPSSKIWLDKYIRLYLGIESLSENEIVYTNMGIYVIDAPTYEYDIVNNSIQLSLLDLMCKLTGVRNGYIVNGITSIVYQAGENIRSAIIDTLNQGGFDKYICDEAPSPSVIPTDLTFSQGTTYYDILSALRDIYPNYEIYFDTEGIFHYNPIPTGRNEVVQVDDNLWENIVISEKIDVDFQNIKNYIEVWGRTHDPAYFSTATTVSSNQIDLTIAEVTNYEDGVIYGFTLTGSQNLNNFELRINDNSYLPVLSDNGSNVHLVYTAEADEEIYFCVQYLGDEDCWHWLGHLQAYAVAKDDNEDSPFYINSSIGEIKLPLYGGEFENCITDDLAQQRADYELYMHTNMQNSLTLVCAPVNWLDVNILTAYTSLRNNESNLYLIKSISFGFDIDDTMQVNLIKYYPEYGSNLEIITQPLNQKALILGNEYRFNVEAQGKDLSYQWQYSDDNGSTWNNCAEASANIATLSIVSSAELNNYKYRCIIQDGFGSIITTNEVTFTVLVITTQPQSIELEINQTATFAVVALGNGLTYQWQYSTDGTTWNNCIEASANTDTLSITTNVDLNNYKYRCQVQDQDNTLILSDEATLLIFAITSQPQNVTTTAGTTITFSVVAIGTALTYQWQYKTSSGTTWNNSTASTAKSPTLSTTVQSNFNGRSYRCRVTNTNSETITSNTASLTVT